MSNLQIGLFLVVLVFSPFCFRVLVKWRDDKSIRSAIAFDRIARLADVGEKDIHYRINDERLTSLDGCRIYKVQFLYDCYERGKNTNPIHYVGDAELVFPGQSNSEVEERIADTIVRIKALYN